MDRLGALALLSQVVNVAAQAAKARFPEPKCEPPTDYAGEGFGLVANIIKEKVELASDENIVVSPVGESAVMTGSKSVEVSLTAPREAREVLDVCANTVQSFADVQAGVEQPTPQTVKFTIRVGYV